MESKEDENKSYLPYSSNLGEKADNKEIDGSLVGGACFQKSHCYHKDYFSKPRTDQPPSQTVGSFTNQP
jgi:hypothetical protein